MKLSFLAIAQVSYAVTSKFLEQVTGVQRPDWYELPPQAKEDEQAAVQSLIYNWPAGEVPPAGEMRTVTVPVNIGDAEEFLVDQEVEVPGLNTERMMSHLRRAVVAALR